MVGVLLAGVLLAVLNQTLLSPALPAIMADLAVDATTVQWLTSGYSLVEAVIIPLAAYLIGRFTTRQLFISAIAIFGAGSLAATIAPNFGVLLLGRVLQAAGTGMAMPMVSTVILLVFPRESRGTAMGIIGLVIGFAPAVGPSLAGVLVDTVGWRALFAIVTVLAAAVVLLACLVLRNYGDFARIGFDKPSVALSSVGLVCLLYGLSSFTSSDNMALVFGLMLVGVVLLGLFVRRQLHLEAPMLKVDILKTRKYATAVVVIVIVQAALVGTGVITPLYIQNVRGFSATMSGVAMLPGAVLGAVLGLVGGRLFDRFGVRKVVVPGVLVAVLGGVGLALLGMDTDFIVIVLSYTVLLMGLQFMMTPMNTWGVNSLDNAVIQHAQSLSNTLNQVAGSVGTAVLVSVSALGAAAAPGAPAVEQACMGDHLAFCGVAVLMALAFIVVLGGATDRVRKGQAAVPAAGEEALPDYAAGFSGVTVDARADELLKAGGAFRACDAMNRNPVCASDTATMGEVVKLMAANDTSGMPVVAADGTLAGFISDGDVATYLGRSELSLFDASYNFYRFTDDTALRQRLANLFALNVMSIATRRVVSVEADTAMDEACHVLAERRIKKVPVLRDGRLVGTLSRRDIVRLLAEDVDKLEQDAAVAAAAEVPGAQR